MTVLRCNQFGASPITMAATVAAPARTLILAPTASLATPRGWQALSNLPTPTGRYDEVHCAGGGSLLLFLLYLARKAPRLLPHGRVIFHGPIIYPTAQSCADWLQTFDNRGHTERVDEYDWRRAALSLGLDGELHKDHNHWLAPIAKMISSGRSYELAEKFNDLQFRSEEKGRLIHLPNSEASEDGVLHDVCSTTSDDGVLMQCTETECVDETSTCRLLLN